MGISITVTANNAVFGRVVFVDADEDPTDPTGNIVWTVYDKNRVEVATEVQTITDKVAPGTFEYTYTLVTPGTYWLGVVATVGGEQQAAKGKVKVTWD